MSAERGRGTGAAERAPRTPGTLNPLPGDSKGEGRRSGDGGGRTIKSEPGTGTGAAERATRTPATLNPLPGDSKEEERRTGDGRGRLPKSEPGMAEAASLQQGGPLRGVNEVRGSSGRSSVSDSSDASAAMSGSSEDNTDSSGSGVSPEDYEQVFARANQIMNYMPRLTREVEILTERIMGLHTSGDISASGLYDLETATIRMNEHMEGLRKEVESTQTQLNNEQARAHASPGDSRPRALRGPHEHREPRRTVVAHRHAMGTAGSARQTSPPVMKESTAIRAAQDASRFYSAMGGVGRDGKPLPRPMTVGGALRAARSASRIYHGGVTLLSPPTDPGPSADAGPSAAAYPSTATGPSTSARPSAAGNTAAGNSPAHGQRAGGDATTGPTARSRAPKRKEPEQPNR
jgi:hypothetical protein